MFARDLFDFLSGGFDDPAKAASPYLDKIPGVGEKYYNPFIDAGKRAGGLLEGEYGKLLNPTSFIDEIMKHYSESAGAKYTREKLGKGIGATAASGGYAGTPEHQRQYGEMADKIMSQDMQQFLQNALGVYDRGLSGEQDIYGKGFSASGSLADMIAGMFGSQAGLAFQGTQQNNMNRQALMNAIMKALATGAGGAMGGVGGASVGSRMF